MNESDHDGDCEDRLCHDHGSGREQKAGEAEGSRARQDEIDRQPNYDRRQAKQRLSKHNDRLPPPKLADGERAAQGSAD